MAAVLAVVIVRRCSIARRCSVSRTPPTADTEAAAGDPGVARDPVQALTVLDPGEQARIVNRLRRAQGQLAGLVRMLEEGRDCEDVITQLAAVSKALDRAGFAIISSGLRQCLATDPAQARVRTDRLQRLFLSLA
jgi:DNA-binding FrmR family transcriptional regulator